ncbi:phage tail spike protein [Clostridium taeniosporum]|uniref:Endopeptidase n=1 Tax=Clostridium taeniosporum TaxID=394958 RepID=A0A1D7XM00_9CLOT|nr:phage tail spike protein [Clostridium taeniosporum]AOR24297.1 endopeptidase [Clostridium taeniosporum]
MINLYEKNETNFKHNAYVLNETIKCEITEEINNSYEINLEYPLHDSKNFSNLFVPGEVVKVPSWDDRKEQLFVIRRFKPSLNNSISVYAQHIFFSKMDGNVVLDTFIEGKTRKQAVQQILNNTINPHKFNIGNKDKSTDTNNLRIVRYSVLDALIGSKDNTIKNRYGGELVPDNFTVDFVNKRGKYTGIKVTYAKNITGAEATFGDIDLITEIIPVGANGLMIPEKSVKASNFDVNNPYTRVIEFSNIGVVEAQKDNDGNITNEDEICTEEQAIKKLRKACLDKFNIEHVNEINFNLNLNFVELCDCINFEENDYSDINSRVAIGDTINVNIKPFGLTQKGRIYRLTRDAITGRLISCEIGYKRGNLADTLNKTNSKIDDTNSRLEKAKEELSKKTNNLKVTMEKKDNEIELSVENEAKKRKSAIEVLDGKIDLSVKNEKKARETAIEILDGKIENRVTEDDFSSYKRQTSKEISQKISSGEEFSSEMRQNVTTFQFLFNKASGQKTEITSDGIAIYDGGLIVKDRRGHDLMWFDKNGNCHVNFAHINDLSIDKLDVESSFYSSLANMKSVWFNEVGIGSRLNCNSDTFYINRGYNLDEYIEKKCHQMLKSQGLI